MSDITLFDKLVAEKVYRKCIDNGKKTYKEISLGLNTSESFAKNVFSSKKSKLNLYHLIRLSYYLDCDINDFLPNHSDYEKALGSDFTDIDEENFIFSIERSTKHE